ncbi:MAG: aa3-type cytochrome c oxidase subunit IV [Sphingomonas sp.]|nr:aa3-type cytochrome c oxidase subunit IV [Sphingomonas sp.]MBO9622083.1 aa3-type cytochrome c oxidase subunit IV [Sphingomonas sp.]
MADTGNTTNGLTAHQATYNGFTKMMLWGTVVAFLLGAFVVFTIAS